MASRSWGELRKQGEDATRPLADGWYDVRVTKAEATEASTGSPMIKVQFQVIDGPQAGRMLFTNLVLSENAFALSLFFKRMDALGLDGAFFDSLTGADSDPAQGLPIVANNLVGRLVSVELGTRVYQGTERNEVNNYRKFNGQVSGLVQPPNMVGGATNGAPVPSLPTSAQGTQTGMTGSAAPVPSVVQAPVPNVTPAPVPNVTAPSTSSENNEPPPPVPAF